MNKNSNKKTVLVIAAIVVALFGLMWWGRRNAATGPTPGQLTDKSALAATEMLYDFGSVSMGNGKVNHVFKVKNPTDADILVTDLVTSCMCTTAYIVEGDAHTGPFGMAGMGYVPKANKLIKAHGSADIEMVFDPAAHGPAGVGPIDRFAYLTDAKGATLGLEIKAVVTP